MGALSERQLAVAAHVRYTMIGSWDGWRCPLEMQWDQSCYHCKVETFYEQEEVSFQILHEGRWNRRIFPNMAGATPDMNHGLIGPSADHQGLCWTLRAKHDDGTDVVGIHCFDVRLHVSADELPQYVDWIA